MNEIINKEEIKVENMIYEIKGKQIVLDRDLAKLYKCKNGTKEVNQAVNRNTDKFPNRFSWILNEEELNDLRSQIVTSSYNESHGGRRYAIRIFTEQGVAMLATILKTEIATEASIRIMDAFVAMRHYISSNLLSNSIGYKFLEYDERIGKLEKTFDSFKEKK